MNIPKTLVPILLLGLSACGNDVDGTVAATPADAETAPAPVVVPAAAAVPAAPASPATAPVVGTAAESVAILNSYLAAWNEHDASKAGSFFDEDVQYFDASFAGIRRGRQSAVEQGVSAFLHGVPDLRWEVRSEPVASADGIAYEWTLTGTNSGTWGGVPATNQKINLKGMSFVRFKNGKIAYQAIYYDGATLNKQLGY
jgi:steroid delta-isomerase-like uncharacterized protein